MQKYNFEVKEEEAGQRIDKFLAKKSLIFQDLIYRH